MARGRGIDEIKDRAAGWLLELPGVVAVGIGSKEVGDEPTGELAIKVFVKVKRSSDSLSDAETIPAEIEGVRTDVIESGEIHPHADLDPPGAFGYGDTEKTPYRPLRGGIALRRVGSAESGTLGCFLVDNPDEPKVAYALTAFHVVAMRDTEEPKADKTKMGQPLGEDSVSGCSSDVVGVFSGGGKEENVRDEALVRLNPGIQWMADILEIGAIKGTRRLHHNDPEVEAQTYKVRKRGARTGLTGGVVRSVKTTTGGTDNLIVVMPKDNPASGPNKAVFSDTGDSGAAVVNKDKEVVGLHWGGNGMGDGFAFAIDHVIERLSVVAHIPLKMAVASTEFVTWTVPGAAMVATPPELRPALGHGGEPAPAFRAAPPPPAPGWVAKPWPADPASASLGRDLNRSAAGRWLTTFWLEHQAELLTLVNTNRAVARVWHRSGASALFQSMARMPLEPHRVLPSTIHGRPLSECLDRVEEIFDRFGSAPLRRDLTHARRLLPDLGGLTYPQIVDSLGAG